VYEILKSNMIGVLLKNRNLDPDVAVHICSPSELGGEDRSLLFKASPGKKLVRPSSPRYPDQNGLEIWFKWWSACFASTELSLNRTPIKKKFLEYLKTEYIQLKTTWLERLITWFSLILNPLIYKESFYFSHH
jgi:hypothetical protein